jgi:hypothetical protein
MSPWFIAVEKGEIEVLIKLKYWVKVVLTQEDLKSMFLDKDNSERTLWHIAPDNGKIDLFHTLRGWAKYILTQEESNIFLPKININPLFAELILLPFAHIIRRFKVYGSMHHKYIQQDTTYKVYLYLETSLHVSGGTSTHHQEHIQLYLQHLVFVTPLLLSATIVEDLEQF